MKEHDFSDLIRDFGKYDFLCPVFCIIDERTQAGNSGSVVFGIRTKEQGHNVPHIHARQSPTLG